MAEHKHAIRQVFHAQLKQLWQTHKFLRDHRVDGAWLSKKAIPATQVGSPGYWHSGKMPETMPLSEAVANLHKGNGYRFVPLVCEEFELLCSLDILFLRRDFPLGVISAGDLDNRVKTLIDTLRKPHSAAELRGNETPKEGENPFYCLLEDDDLVTGLKVETDMLLNPPTDGDKAQSDVKLVISVELKPDNVTMFNLSFA